MTAFARVAIALLAAPVLFIGGYERGLHAGYTATWPVIQKDAGMYVACEQEIDRLKIEVNRLSGIMLPARNQGVQRVFDASQAPLVLPDQETQYGKDMLAAEHLFHQQDATIARQRWQLKQTLAVARLAVQGRMDALRERGDAREALKQAQRGGVPCIAQGK